jgi:hypothetical protein
VVTLRGLTELGVGFVSLTEALELTTPAGRAMAGMVVAVFAEFERERIRCWRWRVAAVELVGLRPVARAARCPLRRGPVAAAVRSSVRVRSTAARRHR